MLPILVEANSTGRKLLLLAFTDNGQYGIVVKMGGQLERIELGDLSVWRPTMDFPVGPDEYTFSITQTMAPDPA